MKAFIVDDNEVHLLETDSSESTIITEFGGGGPSGKSAYEVAVDNGFEGTVTEWLNGLKAGAEITLGDRHKIMTNDGSAGYWSTIEDALHRENIHWDLSSGDTAVVQFKRGDTSFNDSFVGSVGEITLDLQSEKIRVHDGVTPGGHSAANMDDVQTIHDRIDSEVLTLNNTIDTKIPLAEKAQPEGVATLDINGLVPQEQMDVVYTLNGRLGDVVIDKTDVGLDQVDNTADVVKPISNAQQEALDTKIPLAEKAQAEGVATLDINGYVPHNQLNSVLSLNGYTGYVTIDKTDVGLNNVDNTSDINKPISTDQQAALDLKADLDSPSLTGIPTAPTVATGTVTDQLATTKFVSDEIGLLNTGVSGVSGVDPIIITGTSVYPVVEINAATQTARGTMSAADKTKIDGIESGAQVNDVTTVAGRVGDVVVTQTDVGLSNVANYSMATNTEAVNGNSNTAYMSPQRVKEFIESGDYILDGGTF